MRSKNFPLKSKLVIYIVVGVFLVLAVSTAVIINTVTSQEEKLAYQKSIEMASNYANQFDADMKANSAIAKTLALTMENYEASNRTEVVSVLKNILEKNPNLIGVYVDMSRTPLMAGMRSTSMPWDTTQQAGSSPTITG